MNKTCGAALFSLYAVTDCFFFLYDIVSIYGRLCLLVDICAEIIFVL